MKHKREVHVERKIMIGEQDISLMALCSQIFDRHSESISIKNRRVAVTNLCSIISATLELTAEKGFHAMSLRDLSTRSKLSMGALYSYFDSKEALAQMILVQVIETTRQVLGYYSDPKPRNAESARELIKTYVQLTSAMPSWFLFTLVDMPRYNSAFQRQVLEGEQFIELHIFDALQNELGNIEGTTEISTLAMLARSMLAAWASRPEFYAQREIGADEFAGGVILFLDLALGSKETLRKAMHDIQEKRIKFIYGV